MPRWRMFVAGWAALITVTIGCKESDGPTVPSGPPATLADLVGNWAGYLSTDSATGVCYGFTWSPTQVDSRVAGASAIAAIDITSNRGMGMMTATLSGGNLSLAMEFPAGSFTRSNNAPTCSMRGTGTARAGQTLLSGTVNLNWTQSCVGTVFGRGGTSQTGVLTLTKGGSVPTRCP